MIRSPVPFCTAQTEVQLSTLQQLRDLPRAHRHGLAVLLDAGRAAANRPSGVRATTEAGLASRLRVLLQSPLSEVYYGS